MFTYEYLAVRPGAFRSLCGLSVAEFNVLFPEWLRAEQEKRATSRRTRREDTLRQRAPGAAGDLAAVLTLSDEPMTALPRVIVALGRGRRAPVVLNAVIRRMRDRGEIADPAAGELALAAEAQRALDLANAEH